MSNDSQKAAYQELCNSYRAIDDFRMKLLGLLPFATGAGIVLVSNALAAADDAKQNVTRELLWPIGLFGFVITLGLLFFELYGIKKCHALIETGKAIERQLEISGQFTTRPGGVFGVINEAFAASVIYPAVLAAWLYLADAGAARPPASFWSVPATWVFVTAFAVVAIFQILLVRRVRWV